MYKLRYSKSRSYYTLDDDKPRVFRNYGAALKMQWKLKRNRINTIIVLTLNAAELKELYIKYYPKAIALAVKMTRLHSSYIKSTIEHEVISRLGLIISQFPSSYDVDLKSYDAWITNCLRNHILDYIRNEYGKINNHNSEMIEYEEVKYNGITDRVKQLSEDAQRIVDLILCDGDVTEHESITLLEQKDRIINFVVDKWNWSSERLADAWFELREEF